jgi:hypothetical protein
MSFLTTLSQRKFLQSNHILLPRYKYLIALAWETSLDLKVT